jgi:anti-sigma-K factor RskA
VQAQNFLNAGQVEFGAPFVRQWERPAHDWGGKTAWRLFNAATLALAGKVAEKPDLTKQLHKVIDGVCETVH